MTKYLPGVAFLALCCAAITLPFALLLRNRARCIILSVICSTVALNLWAWFDMGGFDLTFALSVLIIALVTATSVTELVNRSRNRSTRRTTSACASR